MPSDSLSTRAIASRSCLLALGWIGITAALYGVGQFVVHSNAITDVDRHVTNWVVAHRTPALDAMMRAVTWLGSWVTAVIAGGVIVVLTVTRRLRVAVPILFAVAWAGEYALVNLVKHAVGRPRPPRDLWLVTAHGASFPSGHAANATVVCAVGAVVVFLLTRRRPARATAVALGFLVIAAVSLSRVELGVHWTTDVVAGSLATAVWLTSMTVLFTAIGPGTGPGAHTDPSASHRSTD